ncbi:hypothetical protein MD484_g4722, partial [Candolleomyces efflorescens]
MSKPRFVSKREAMSKKMRAKAHKEQTTVKTAITDATGGLIWFTCTGCPYCSPSNCRPKRSGRCVEMGGDVRVRNGRMVFEEPLADTTFRRGDPVKATCEYPDLDGLDLQPRRSDGRMVVSLADIKTRIAKPKGVRKEYDWVESVKPVLVMDDWDELEDAFSDDGWEEIEDGKQRSSGRKSYSAVASRKRG